MGAEEELYQESVGFQLTLTPSKILSHFGPQFPNVNPKSKNVLGQDL